MGEPGTLRFSILVRVLFFLMVVIFFGIFTVLGRIHFYRWVGLTIACILVCTGSLLIKLGLTRFE